MMITIRLYWLFRALLDLCPFVAVCLMVSTQISVGCPIDLIDLSTDISIWIFAICILLMLAPLFGGFLYVVAERTYTRRKRNSAKKIIIHHLVILTVVYFVLWFFGTSAFQALCIICTLTALVGFARWLMCFKDYIYKIHTSAYPGLQLNIYLSKKLIYARFFIPVGRKLKKLKWLSLMVFMGFNLAARGQYWKDYQDPVKYSEAVQQEANMFFKYEWAYRISLNVMMQSYQGNAAEVKGCVCDISNLTAISCILFNNDSVLVTAKLSASGDTVVSTDHQHRPFTDLGTYALCYLSVDDGGSGYRKLHCSLSACSCKGNAAVQ